MIHKALIIIPNHQSENEVCDFLKQTTQVLSQHNYVYIIDYTSGLSLKEILLQHINGKKKSLHVKKRKITHLTPIYLIPFRRVKFIQKINMFLYMYLLEIALFLTHSSPSHRIIWMFFPQLSHLIQVKIPQWKIIYDINDFYTSPNPRENTRLAKQKKLLLRKSENVFAISKSLKNKYGKLSNKKISLVPQGFSVQNFSKIKKLKEINIPQDKPKIGFVGQISQRLDYKLLNNLITNNPQWYFIFIGPKNFNQDITPKKNRQLNEIFNYPNCLWFDRQPKANIPSIINKFDITMIPYDISLDFNRYCYPMKVFEYFYMGKPVISTPIEELKQHKFKNLIKTGDNHRQWEKHIRDTLNKKWSKENKNKQKKMAMDNSWEEKIKSISVLFQLNQ